MTPFTQDDIVLTKRQKGFLRSADRKCGMSYRSACGRGIEIAMELQDLGLLTMYDTGRNLGQFVFRTTGTAKDILNDG